MIEPCIICNKELKIASKYCCSGRDCGCNGQEISVHELDVICADCYETLCNIADVFDVKHKNSEQKIELDDFEIGE